MPRSRHVSSDTESKVLYLTSTLPLRHATFRNVSVSTSNVPVTLIHSFNPSSILIFEHHSQSSFPLPGFSVLLNDYSLTILHCIPKTHITQPDMRASPPLSVASSLTSSFEHLSLSSSDLNSSTSTDTKNRANLPIPSVPNARASFSSEGSRYEIILVPQVGTTTTRSSLSGESIVLVNNAGEGKTPPAKVKTEIGMSSTSAQKRRERRKNQSACTPQSQLGPSTLHPNTSVKSEPGIAAGQSISQTMVKTEPLVSSASDSDKQPRKTRRGGHRTRSRRERAQVRDILVASGSDAESDSAPLSQTPVRPTLTLTSSSPSSNGLSDGGGQSWVTDSCENSDDDSEVDAMSALGAGSACGTPVRRKVKVEPSLLSMDDAKTSIDR
jgi:hypothetical protein